MCFKTLPCSILVAGLFLAECGSTSDTNQISSENPEIHLGQNSTSLPSGTGEYVFGNPILIDGDGGYLWGATFTIENLGQQDLNIYGIELSSGDTEDFDLITPDLPDVVEPSSSMSFSVQFDPLVSLGMRSAVVTITSNDEDEGSYTFTVKGFGMKRLLANDNSEEDRFGASVAIAGDILVAGAPGDDIGSNSDQGSAYVFYRNQGGSDNWGEVKKLFASDGAVGDRFGRSLAISGNTIVVGAFFDDIGSNSDQGSVYIY